MRREEDVSIDRSGSLSLGTAAHEMMRNGYPYQNLSRIARGRGKPFSGPLSLLQDFTFPCGSEVRSHACQNCRPHRTQGFQSFSTNVYGQHKQSAPQ